MSKPNNQTQQRSEPDAEREEQRRAEAAEAAARDEAGDPPVQEEAELPPPDTEQIVQELQQAQAKAADYWDQLMRTRAELDNVQRRSRRDLENAHKYALERFLNEFLPVQDSLELGAAAAGEGADVAKLREGMELTLNLVRSLFDKFEIKEINPLGEKFNPEYHQAMAAAESAGAEPNTVVTVYQKGYLLADRLLRPALVVVAKGQDGAGKIDESA